MYADDYVLVISGKSRREERGKLENIILLLNSYFRANTLCMNLKTMHFRQVRKKVFRHTLLDSTPKSSVH